jgi:two-component system sensor histidine kinase UhpB
MMHGDAPHRLRASGSVTEDTLRRLNESLELQAKSIAQALHDEAGQFLTAAHIALAEAARDMPVENRERLQIVKNHLDGIEEQLRRIAHELRPRILDDLGLVPALKFLAQGIEKRRGVLVDIDVTFDGRMPVAIETAIYRLVQEALTNVRRHADASHVKIRIEHRRRLLRCTIADDGVGFDGAQVIARLGEHGLGLSGIRNRLETLGGSLEIISSPGRGTELAMTIPFEM